MIIVFVLSMYRTMVNGLATTMNIFKFVAVGPESCSRQNITLYYFTLYYLYIHVSWKRRKLKKKTQGPGAIKLRLSLTFPL